jgi:hypothetical protein
MDIVRFYHVTKLNLYPDDKFKSIYINKYRQNIYRMTSVDVVGAGGTAIQKNW